jgi:hypothetical protein
MREGYERGATGKPGPVVPKKSYGSLMGPGYYPA